MGQNRSFSRFCSAVGVEAVSFLQSDAEHWFCVRARPGVKLVLGHVPVEVLVLEGRLLTPPARLLAAAVRHRMMMAAAALLAGPVVAMAAQNQRHGYSRQQQEGAASRQHIVPVGGERLHQH